MVSSTVLAAVSAASVLSPLVSAFNAGAPTNVAVYYGQGANQPRLSQFCQETSLDIINLAFLNTFPEQGLNGFPGTNFGNQCGSETFVIDGKPTQLYSNCQQITDDIPICQAAGKKVFLSLGGASPANQQISDDASAIAFADFVWFAFGPITQEWTDNNGPRPFGNVVLDGFDFDIEHNGGNGYATMANQLVARFAEFPSKKFYLSAAPQCGIPDAQLSDAIAKAPFDFIWPQFYNNYCSAGVSVGPVSIVNPLFNFDDWVDVVKNSANPSAKLYIGLPASEDAASGYYLPPNKVKQLVKDAMKNYPDTFGGIMLWEATASEGNKNNKGTYADNMKDILLDCAPPQPTTTAPATTAPATSAPASSAPASSAPASSAPASSAPASSAPASSAPASSAPASSAPASSAPASSAPASSAPASSAPASSAPASSAPASSAPSSSKPVIRLPTSTPPVSSAPVSSPPASSAPASSAPATEPASSAPASSAPASSVPTGSSPVSTPPASSGSATGSSSRLIPTSGSPTGTGTTSSFTVGRSSSAGITSAPSGSPTTTGSQVTITTVVVTSYIDICPTGFTTITTTYTTTYCPGNGPATPTPTGGNGNVPTGASPAPTTSLPEGWTTTVTVCTQCAATPTTVTLTRPVEVPTTPAGESPSGASPVRNTRTTTVTVTLPCETGTAPSQPAGPGPQPTPTSSRPLIHPPSSYPASSFSVQPSSTPSQVPTNPTGTEGVSPVFTGGAMGLRSGMAFGLTALLTALVLV